VLIFLFLGYWFFKWWQLLERALEASGDDLDSAIKSLNELRLESEALASAAVSESENCLSTALKLSAEGTSI
jgi:hypothetical protein